MKIKKISNLLLTLVFILFSLLILVFRYFPDYYNNREGELTFPQGYEIGIWEWRVPTDFDIKKSLNLLKADGITTVYLNIGEYIDIYELKEKEKIDIFNNAVKNYIEFANRYGIKVHALAGGPLWSKSSHDYLPNLIIDYVSEFNQQNPQMSFDGIQFDIESYNQSEFNANKIAIMVEYLSMSENIINKFKEFQDKQRLSDNMKLGFAVPYWFDGENNYMPTVNWKGEIKSVFNHLANRLNRLRNGYFVIMAYRNSVDGEDGSVAISIHEIKFTNQYMPKINIFVGQETTNINPPKITFFNKNKKDVKKAAQDIAAAFEKYPNFKGISINDVEHYSKLP